MKINFTGDQKLMYMIIILIYYPQELNDISCQFFSANIFTF